MRAIFSSISVVGLFFLLAGCGSADSNTGSVDSIDAGQTVKTSSTKTEGQSIFVGTIESITQVEEEETLQLKLVDVMAKEDPANMGTSFSNDGVILNATAEKISVDINELKIGDKVQFTLVEMPIMTMSIPPQVPGDSIIDVSLNK
ncbi:hypothetical protein [Enterococcus faecium]|uniref:hypothetical protein n=1 Tax=Enterococcus faecium TaxID=1352 RepID=UPI000CF1EECF|nr:hypothetical protein [Enterococcus faecium]EGP5556403.1 hypothetical protein [Enterococcus faecium]EKZ0100443.1 hypothetical protein [Enterococcus faecium]EME3592473.1 hypothetical protein [Enterococcus faecium]EMF0342203.1 hypothetical protein [Enterococcus faecium]MDQ8565650.1 hypothetical protein [Enterococcus faecium]